MKRVILLGCLILAACIAQPKSEVAALEASLSALENAALVYARLPLCPAEPLCSEREVLMRIGEADRVAFAAVANLKVAVDKFGPNDVANALALAQAALSTFTSLMKEISK